MRSTRREFLQTSAGAMLWAGLPATAFASAFTELQERFPVPIELDQIDLVQTAQGKFLRVTSTARDIGVVAINNKLEDGLSILQRRITPYFLGKDARRIEALIEGVFLYRSNYKFAGMPFWNAVGHVELAILDMLARIKSIPVSKLFAPRLRTELPVYVTRFDRLSRPADEVEMVLRALERTGAKAVKLKIGLRMKNSPEQTQRDLRLLRQARSKLGEDVAIYVDANGSYTADEAIRIGHELLKHGVGFFEEPCRWEDYEGTRKVAAALDLPIAGGEQDTSLGRIREMIHRPVVDLIQPDVYYCGGFIRSLRIAELAAAKGIQMTPHNPRVGLEALPALQLCSIAESFGPAFEHVESNAVQNGVIQVPVSPGLGLEGSSKEWLSAPTI